MAEVGSTFLSCGRALPCLIPVSHYIFSTSWGTLCYVYVLEPKSKKVVVSLLSACCAFLKLQHHRCAVLPQRTEYILCPRSPLAEPSMMHAVGKDFGNRVPIHCCRVVCFSCVTKAVCGTTQDIAQNNIGHGYPSVVLDIEKGKKIPYCSRWLG